VGHLVAAKTLPRPLEIYAAVSYQITLLIMTTGMEIMEAASQPSAPHLLISAAAVQLFIRKPEQLSA